MRLAVVTTWYPSREDRVEGVFVARHVEALRRAPRLDLDVDVVHLASRPGTPLSPDVTRVVVDRRDPASLLAARRTVHRRLERADVLHTHVFSTLLLLAGFRTAVPWVHSEHWSGVSDPQSGGPVWQRLAGARRLLARPDVVTAVSGYLADAVRPFRRGQLDVVPNVVPVPDRPTPADDDGRLRLLSVGNLRPVKDPLLAVEVLAELRRRGHDAVLRWVGDGPLRAGVERRATELGVRDRLTLLGRLAPEQFAHEWGACRVFLLPSHYETFCVAGAEALGHGRPAVLGARGGARDFAGPGVHLVADRAVASWADAVEAAAADRLDPGLIAGPIRDHFSPGAVAEGFSRVLGSVGRPRSTRPGAS
ncbi:glycosyltransferase [Kineococcus sp. SYSU DK003]|uniref:glycosyltransferase n=1 Tax=Kineococcus sp. SYSU DK003 TaxID=3383124 RepID=UPI003D7CBF52